jgi:hypothetical protein
MTRDYGMSGVRAMSYVHFVAEPPARGIWRNGVCCQQMTRNPTRIRERTCKYRCSDGGDGGCFLLKNKGT